MFRALSVIGLNCLGVKFRADVLSLSSDVPLTPASTLCDDRPCLATPAAHAHCLLLEHPRLPASPAHGSDDSDPNHRDAPVSSCSSCKSSPPHRSPVLHPPPFCTFPLLQPPTLQERAGQPPQGFALFASWNSRARRQNLEQGQGKVSDQGGQVSPAPGGSRHFRRRCFRQLGVGDGGPGLRRMRMM